MQKPEGSPGQQNSVSSTSGGDTNNSSAGGSTGGQQVTIIKKSGEGGSADQSSKGSGESKPGAGTKPANEARDGSEAPGTEPGEKQSSIINTDAPSVDTKKTVLGDESKVFVPISGQSEKIPITTSVGGIVTLSGKEREAMVPPMQTFITPSTGSGVAVTTIVSTPPRTTVPESAEEEERERQLTERLAQQGDHGMAHNPDSASTLLPEVQQLFDSHSQGGTVPGQGGVPLPGQLMQGGYANYPAGYNYNMGPMQPQQGYYSWGRVPMG